MSLILGERSSQQLQNPNASSATIAPVRLQRLNPAS
jgi:hypothetical protein